MPAILDRRDYAVWLTAAPAVAKTVLKPLQPQYMLAHPVSPRINSFQNDDEHLIRPVSFAGNISRLASV
jgi:putative SOS response-associated peptidase YedK